MSPLQKKVLLDASRRGIEVNDDGETIEIWGGEVGLRYVDGFHLVLVPRSGQPDTALWRTVYADLKQFVPCERACCYGKSPGA